jgi:hypothetical protein
LQWLTVSFFWSRTGKILPGKHGQQDLIAARRALAFSPIYLKSNKFQNWHDPRITQSEPDAWESRWFNEPPSALGEADRGFARGELRWRTRLSSRYRAK